MSIPVKIHINKNESINVFVYDRDYNKAIKTKGSLAYWIRGIGHKKSKKFEKIEGLPKRGDKLNWLQIAQITDQYGLNIGEEYADTKVAGIIARQTAAGYHEMYKRCKHLINPNSTHHQALFDLLRCEYMLSCFGIYELDIIGLDERLSQIDSEYNAKEATWCGEPISMNNYIQQKYGKETVRIIEECLAGPVEWKGRREEIDRFVKQNYICPNVIELTVERFEEWGEEMDITRHAIKTIKEIESHTLTLELS